MKVIALIEGDTKMMFSIRVKAVAVVAALTVGLVGGAVLVGKAIPAEREKSGGAKPSAAAENNAKKPASWPNKIIKGVSPNPDGDTVIDRNTVWRGQKIELGRNLIVKSGNSFTIDACDVLFKSVWPHGKMTCKKDTVITIKDSYVHGKGEKEYAERAAGIVLGGSKDRLTVKISGTTFKYLGDGYEAAHRSKHSVFYRMILAEALYTPESYFRGNSLICDSRPRFYPPTYYKDPSVEGKKRNFIWGFQGGEKTLYAYKKGSHGAIRKSPLKVEDCFFQQIWQPVIYQKYLYGSTIRGNQGAFEEPPADFVLEGNKFHDNTGKCINFFHPSLRGVIRDNFICNTSICINICPAEGRTLVRNNIIMGIISPYIVGWRQTTGGGGNGDGAMYIGNEYIGFMGVAITICGNDSLVAGNRIADCYGGGVGLRPYYTPRYNYEARAENAVIIGNRIERCYGAGKKEGQIQITRLSGTPARYKAKNVVIAGNTIKDNLKYLPRGVTLKHTENILIKKNIIKNNGVGIEIGSDVSRCYIIDNDISGTDNDIIGKHSDSEGLPKAEIVSPATNEFKKGQTVTFKGKGVAKGDKKIVSWWWFFGDDGTISKKQNPTHAFKKDSKYFVCLIVTDSAGLKDVAIMPGRIEAVWNQKDPKRPWPGKKPRLAVYPNPLYLGSNSKPTFVLYYYKGKPSLKIYDSKNELVKEFKEFSMNAKEFDNFTIAPWVKKISLGFYDCLVEWDRKDIRPGKYTAVASDEEGEVARCEFVVK